MPPYMIALAIAAAAFVSYNIGFYRGHKDGEESAQFKIGIIRRAMKCEKEKD